MNKIARISAPPPELVEFARNVLFNQETGIAKERRESVWQAVLLVYEIVANHVFPETTLELDLFVFDLIPLARRIAFKPNLFFDAPLEAIMLDPSEGHPYAMRPEVKTGAALLWVLANSENAKTLENGQQTVIRFDTNPAELIFMDFAGNIGRTDSYCGTRNMKDHCFSLAEHPELLTRANAIAEDAKRMLAPIPPRTPPIAP
jgi:hypothetical protein